ncbi:MAG: 1-deoxy-D-xylulose-5-phosphate synthase [Planctomycetota bacterium]|jgi:1-deoxy-D-xylulose-5-phosphate synthase
MSESALQPNHPRAELLDAIRSPEDLKRLTVDQLPQVCDELRKFLLDAVQNTGGHLGSNLGVVELTTALHHVFDFRRDRLVWDVSHQCYPHKVLTGRRDMFPTLRQTGGLCGFTHPEESPYDLFHTGHAGTSISLGLGMAKALSHEPDRPHVVSVIGDASLGAGVAFEALNHAGSTGERLIVILNDNEWSISKSVGALARYLSRIRSARVVQRAQEEIHGLLSSIPLIGSKVESTIEQVREVLRHTIVQGHVFEELGVTYVGPLDGHDVKLMTENLKRVSELNGVVLLHTLTEKGKGHPSAPTHPERVHGVKARKSPEAQKIDAMAATKVSAKSFTGAFAESLAERAESDVRVQVVTAGMPSGTGLVDFAERFPSRFHDTGITEQHAIAFAAGMAKAGMRPVVAIYSTFLQRGFDQVFQEVALQNLPVLFCMDRAGLVGQDGPTHNGVFDIGYLRGLPNMVLAAPRDETDMKRMIAFGLNHDGPLGIRYPRGNCVVHERIAADEREPLEVGRAETLIDGEELVIWAYGAMVEEAAIAVETLRERGVNIGLVDARFAKPIDEELLAKNMRDYRWILTVEEHQRATGFGSALLESWNRLPRHNSRVRVIGITDRYIDHMTTREEQLTAVGLDAESIVSNVVQLLRPKLV